MVAGATMGRSRLPRREPGRIRRGSATMSRCTGKSGAEGRPTRVAEWRLQAEDSPGPVMGGRPATRWRLRMVDQMAMRGQAGRAGGEREQA